MKGKLLLSVATAALIVTGFTGCDTGSNDRTVSATVNPIQQNKFATTIKGVVLDDAGNPVKGAKVYIGSKEAVTNAGGQYEIDGVDVSGYISLNNGQGQVVNAANPISVTILPPANSDMTSAVVTVTPNMIHLENKGNTLTSNAQTAAGNINTQPNSEDFTVMAESLTAVLPHKAATIDAVIRDGNTGQPVPKGTKVTAIWKSLSNNAVAMTPNETVGVNSVVGYVDENGTVKLNGLLTSSNYNFIVEGYAVNNTNVEAQGDTTGNNVDGTLKGLSFNTLNVTNYADKDYITNLGNILVTPVNGEDTIAPTLVFDKNAPSPVGDNVFSYLNTPLEDGTTTGVVYAPGIDGSVNNPLIVNFSEPIKAGAVTANDVIVYDVTNKKVIPVSQISFSNSDKTLEIVTATPIAPNTQLQIRLNRADFRDLADNVLNDSPNAEDVLSGPNNTYVALNASTYFKINMNLTQVKNAQEDNATTVDFTGNGYANKALSTVADVTPGTVPTTLYQMNDNANANSLAALAKVLNGGTAVNVNNNYAKVSFTPDANVSDYYALVVDQNDKPVTTATVYQTDATTALTPKTIGGIKYFDLTNAGVLHNTFIVNNLASGYKVKIYPVNGFGDLGAPTTVTLKDNVPLTTTLNTVGNSVDLQGANSAAGNTGNLVDLGQGAAGTGLPNLFINPKMLKANANAANTQKDLRELTGTQDNIYDANDFANMSKSRTIGFAISEPVNKDAVITDYLKIYETNGSVVNNFVTAAAYTKINNNTQDAIAFTIKNILDMQHYSKVSIAGIEDKAGNVADDMAADKVKDAMPPLVTNAEATTNGVKITFDEPIKLTDKNGNGITFSLNTAPNNATYTFTTNPNGTVTVAKSIQYTDEHGNSINGNTPITLKVVQNGSNGVLELQLPDNYTNGNGNNVDLATYFEDVHGIKDKNGNDNAVATGASELDFANINDLLNNTWATQNYLLNNANQPVEPMFATADMISPKIAPAANAINPKAATADQLKLAITAGTGASLNVAQNDGDAVWEVGDNTGNYAVEVKFREPIAQTVNGQLKLFSDNADYKVIPANANNNYKILSNAKVTPIAADTIKVTFSKDSSTTGAVQAGDKLVITGVKDASGNETNVTITLNAKTDGISVNTDSYK